MSTTSEKLRGLVEYLYLRTENGKIDWNLTSDKQSVWAKVSDYRLEIVEERNEQFENDVRVTVFNDNGDQIDTFADSYFSRLSPVKVPLQNYFSVMSTLFEMAKRQASGADAAITKILTSLGGSAVGETQVTGFKDDLEDDVPF